jgi:hypothetical protein
MFSLTANIVAGVFTCSVEVEIVEKEKSAKEVDHDLDFEKDKIFHTNINPLSFLIFREIQNLHPATKIASQVLDTEINPPEIKVAS